MHFHEYITLRNQLAKFGHNDDARRVGKAMTSDEFRSFYLKRAAEEMQRAQPGPHSHQLFERFCALSAEQTWVDGERPFYNVWPIAESLACDVKLDLPFSAVEIPFDSMVLRFAYGHEPCKVSTAMLFWPKNWPSTPPNVNVLCYFFGTMDRLTFRFDYDPTDTVEGWLQRIISDSANPEWRSMAQPYRNADPTAASLMIRLVVFIGLLANNHDMITPVVLSKDRTKYESTDEAEVKKWLEKRAIRKLGRGFDVGKQLQAERDASPHWRNPHLCLFWTGPGRTKPVIRMRSGSVVQRVSMAAVPTGYLGPEREVEDAEGGTYIYFVEAVGQERIKIGKADNPEARVMQLQTGSAVELRLLGVIADQPSREAELHAAFAKDRVQGEWFHATAELRDYIARFSAGRTS
ncbi:MAG TPA: GIY-YIG nuclease family protein [Gemmataceae bacterium]|nr:GIY-YIG nuclease family protein [Gemmataceae bacterium]